MGHSHTYSSDWDRDKSEPLALQPPQGNATSNTHLHPPCWGRAGLLGYTRSRSLYLLVDRLPRNIYRAAIFPSTLPGKTMCPEGLDVALPSMQGPWFSPSTEKGGKTP